MVFAVIKTGGKQYKVSEGDVLNIEKIETDGNSITFNEILLMVDGDKVTVGQPLISGATVGAKVLEAEGRAKKKMVFRYKSKTRQRKKKGHRQPYTKVQITKIAP
ncbi:MAG: 50S ribosomal protein L21 [Candidatus Yanofskybacteria bacterium GW2011_GWA1_48_10]|uniref:Large ribosomal subunit protein bL21 n=2 Tax=Candidatus Yanofskyibacteriota TaxID=1752733 RepID=A0A0G1U645_9BACT|nr:MAG: 50S ribosomal protein L21 [Candidatus Yanofskybacteria bacterium GW2011_GWA1_48_10]OGN06559.1 MAG: 50S ribosomal protein L21 [Candidatus Yanofskybacteria bacterium RIFCSPHIGHO2_01_FULL_48_25b]